MNDAQRLDSFVRFAMTVAWMIILVVAMLIFLNYIGAFDSFYESRFFCTLGDGVECKNWKIIINDKYLPSDGDEDYALFTLRNTKNETMQGVHLFLKECLMGFENESVSLKPFEEANYTIIGCTGIKPNSRFSSEIELRYKTNEEDTVLSHVQYGSMTSKVISPEESSAFANFKKGLRKWIKENMG